MRWNGRGEVVCPLRGQSLESRLAAQRSVVRTMGETGVSPLEALLLGAFLLSAAEILLLGNLRSAFTRIAFEVFTVSVPASQDQAVQPALASLGLKAVAASAGSWLVRPMTFLEYGPKAAAYTFGGLGVLRRGEASWQLSVFCGTGIPMLVSGFFFAAPGPVAANVVAERLIGWVVLALLLFGLQVFYVRRVFTRIRTVPQAAGPKG